jgi:hypothetical protein
MSDFEALNPENPPVRFTESDMAELNDVVELVSAQHSTTKIAGQAHKWLEELYPDKQQLNLTDISYLVALAMETQHMHDDIWWLKLCKEAGGETAAIMLMMVEEEKRKI